MRNGIATCVLGFWLLGAALMPSGVARAEPKVTAKVDRSEKGRTMKGSVEFDFGGGPITGSVKLATPTHPESPVRAMDGTPLKGKFDLQITLDGNYDGGSFGAVHGTARLKGTFTDEMGQASAMSAKGTFTGSVSGPNGFVEARCEWKEVAFEGGKVKTPQPFATRTTFVFEPTEAIPKLNAPLPSNGISVPPPTPKEGGTKPGAGDKPAGGFPAWGWAAGGAVLLLVVVVVLALGRRARGR
ncbi:MAG: hypothetical protein K8T89_10220 [Planctomycetes bacterium]|nr:hypothetical protein [Planctomycetota bacterium]